MTDGNAFYLLRPGYLRVEGSDARVWLDRQSTNDLRQLALARAVRTVLTSPTARILDVLTVVEEGASLGVVPLPGYAERTLRYLRGRIFFMDQVKVVDASSDVTAILCDGQDLTPLASALGLERLPTLDEIVAGEVNEHVARVIGVPGVGGVACLLLVPASELAQAEEVLRAAGIAPIAEEEYEILRVEVGLPGPGHELTEDYTPLEVGLEDLIAEGKCYPGQEVIARQITYDKVVRRMVKLQLEGPVSAGAEVRAEGKSVGKITSAVVSPRQGPIALAVVRKPYFAPGTTLDVLEDTREVRGRVL